MNNIIVNYFKVTLSYGAIRGIFYNYDRKDICANDKIFMIFATSLINPVYFYRSLMHDTKNIDLFLEGKKIDKKDWIKENRYY